MYLVFRNVCHLRTHYLTFSEINQIIAFDIGQHFNHYSVLINYEDEHFDYEKPKGYIYEAFLNNTLFLLVLINVNSKLA